MTPILKIQGLTHRYSVGTPFEHTAIDNINLEIPKGQFVGLIGHTGSGKSTFIQHLNGLLRPSAGTVYYEGKDIFASRTATRDVRFKVGLVFQYPEYQLFEETVYADVAFGPKNMGLDKAEIDRRVRENCRIVGLSDDVLDKSPFELSGGQKRRVALAGIFAMEPEVMVLDEPMAGLDPAGCADVFRFIKEYHKTHGTTILFVTHSMEYAAQMSERIVVMDHGHILMDGTPAQVFARADELIAAGLDVPQVTRVFLELKKHGVDVDPAVFTVEQAVQCLKKLKGGVC